jgi:O-antigen biosynthesis protein
MEKISVVIVSWNVAESLKKCLSSVFATNYPRLEVLVVDNNSSDNSVEVIRSFRRVKLIKNATNIGFPKAVNQGFRNSTGDYVLLLNPDTKIPKNFFEKAVDFCEHFPDVGVMGPKFVNADGSSQGSVFPEPSVIGTIREFWFGEKGLTSKYTPKQNWPHPVNAVSGGCMFIPRHTLQKVGLFTEEVFMYYEDLDFCRRVRNSRLKNFFNPEIEILHEHGSSAKQTSLDKYRTFLEVIIYPIRKVLNIPNNLPSVLRYRTEAGLWYNGWFKSLVMAFVAWSGQKLRKNFNIRSH